jgi:MauM/NapG family ferredoxin protein
MRRISFPRASQLLFLAIFLVLFLMTEYRGEDRITAAVNAFFRADPLVAVSFLLAARGFTLLLLPALLMVAATLLLGRFFCGWVCPLGTILDLLPGKRGPGAPPVLRKLRWWVLLPILGASLFSLNLAGLLDPLAILLRGLSISLHPLLGHGVRQGWAGLYGVMGEGRDVLAPAYNLVRDYILPFRTTFYPLALLSFLMLGGVLLLEKVERRCWCRRLCPLGTLLGFLGSFSPFRRRPSVLCGDCGACRQLCPTSFDGEELRQGECILCLECRDGCPHDRIRFSPGAPQGGDGYLPGRRQLLGGMLTGMAFPFLVRYRSLAEEATLLRPPGVRDETAFLAACVRCGECMKVCLRSALYPSVFQGGAAGLYTPVLVPRLGYCEYNCTLCGQVCPTGAIPSLAPAAKRLEVVGQAVFVKDRCLPFAKGVDCIVCEEHCPIPGKAIRFRQLREAAPDGAEVTLKKPYVVDELCNGCGICEHVCPVEGRPGIEVLAVTDRHPLADPMTLKDRQAGAAAAGEGLYPP